MARSYYTDYAWVTPQAVEKARRLVRDYRLTTEQIAERFSWPVVTARSVLGKCAIEARAKRTPELDAKIMELHEDGFTLQEIGLRVGGSTTFVDNAIKRMRGR